MEDILFVLWAVAIVLIWKYPTIKRHIESRKGNKG